MQHPHPHQDFGGSVWALSGVDLTPSEGADAGLPSGLTQTETGLLDEPDTLELWLRKGLNTKCAE